jgi:hypothetical protein
MRVELVIGQENSPSYWEIDAFVERLNAELSTVGPDRLWPWHWCTHVGALTELSMFCVKKRYPLAVFRDDAGEIVGLLLDFMTCNPLICNGFRLMSLPSAPFDALVSAAMQEMAMYHHASVAEVIETGRCTVIWNSKMIFENSQLFLGCIDKDRLLLVAGLILGGTPAGFKCAMALDTCESL